MSSGHHLSLSLSRELWNELLAAALPFPIADGEFDLAEGARNLVRQLQVRERVAGLLEDTRTPQPLVRFGERALSMWERRRGGFYRRLSELVRVEGTWKVEVDGLGTELSYGPQRVEADAFVKGVAVGQITFLRENLTVPFRIEKRVGASLALGRVRFSRERDAVIGNVQDLAVHLGDNAVLQLLGQLIEYGVQQRVEAMEPVQVLGREQVAGLVGGMGGAMRMQMGVDDLQLDITDREMTLKVRFGFSPLPTDRQIAAGDDA
jgi:hypothetical protein